MAKKQWIKFKSGLFRDAKHRQAIGDGIWLYGYLIDKAEFEGGVVDPFKDADCAEEMGASVGWVRKYRRKLEAAGYISVTQLGQKGLRITIMKWVNPRSYDGAVVNLPKQSVTPVTPSESGVKNQSVTQSDTQSVTQSDTDRTPLCTDVEHAPYTNNHIPINNTSADALPSDPPKPKERARNEVFDLVADRGFAIKDTSKVNGTGSRIGKIVSWCKKSNISAAQLAAFYDWYERQYSADISPPRDLEKFKEHYSRFEQDDTPVSSGPAREKLAEAA